VVDGSIILTGDELFHLRKVNRAKAGDEIEVINGKGSLFFGRIRKINKDEALVAVDREESEPRPALTTIIGPSLVKKKAMNLVIEKLTEMGVDEIRPVLYTRTDEKYNSSHLKKWQHLAIQSLKVNKKLWPTHIYPPAAVDEIIEFSREVGTKILLDKEGRDIAGGNFSFPVMSVIGPPGGFEPGEKERFRQAGFVFYKVNDCVLKSETAALSIAAVLKIR
jgi:16S rRNA (uracil1498-N3)-methyltransferase